MQGQKSAEGGQEAAREALSGKYGGESEKELIGDSDLFIMIP